MIIAITSENGKVFQYFGKSKEFTLFDIENNIIKNKRIVYVNEQYDSQLIDFLNNLLVTTLICGDIDGYEKSSLREKRIEIISGVNGNIDDIIVKYLSGEKIDNCEFKCCDTNNNYNK